MSDGHIDQATIQGLLSGGIRGDAALAVAEHLDAGCDACQALFEEDGQVDVLLLALARESAEGRVAGNDLEWARIRRRLRAGRPLRRLAFAAALLVAVGATFGVMRGIHLGGSDGWDGQKGAAGLAVGARLRFSVAPGDGAGRVAGVERGASGAVLPSDASLLFRVEATGPTRLVLVHVAAVPGSAPEVLWEGEARAAGALDVEVDGRPAAFPLHGLSGRQRFALLAAPGLDRPRLDEALRLLAAGPEAAAPLAISLDLVEVTVR